MTVRATEARPALLAAAVTVVLWASAFVVIRSVGDAMSPGAFAFGRLFVGAAALGLLALRYRRPLPRGRSLALVVGYGVLWFGAYNILLNWAEHHLDAGTAALLVNAVAPVLVALGAGLLFGEGFPRPLVMGMVIASAGVVLIAAGGTSGVNDTLGMILGLAATLIYATAVLIQKPALRTVDAVSATWIACTAGVLATVPFAPQAVAEIADAPVSAILGIVYLGLGPTAIAFTLWAYAMTRTDTGTLAATTLCAPAITILLSWITLGELPTPLGFVGGALALGGVMISRRRPRTAPVEAEREPIRPAPELR